MMTFLFIFCGLYCTNSAITMTEFSRMKTYFFIIFPKINVLKCTDLNAKYILLILADLNFQSDFEESNFLKALRTKNIHLENILNRD
jgi:hypothetical protein